MLADVRLKRRSEQRKIISEDQAAQLNQIILQLRPGMAVYGIYYHSKRYIKFSGIVRKMDLPRREMILANEIIAFSDIFELYCDALEVW